MYLLNKMFGYVPSKSIKRVYVTALMFLCIALTYSISRRLKDSIIASRVAVEAISIIKPAVILPATFMLVMIYNFLSDRCNRDNLMYYFNYVFISYFAFYLCIEALGGGLLFKKMSPCINLNQYTSGMLNYPAYLVSLLVNNVFHVIFYAMTELYCTLILSFSFWSFVNRYTSIDDAKSYYPIYGMFSSFSGMLSGLVGLSLGGVIDLFIVNKTYAAEMFNCVSILICIIAMSVSLLLYKISLAEHRAVAPDEPAPKKKKKSGSFGQLFSNKILFFMFLCVVSYMTAINLVELSWKKTMKVLYIDHMKNRIQLDLMLSRCQLISGVFSIVFARVITYIINKFGWTLTALVNPICVGVTGVLFFFMISFFKNLDTFSIVHSLGVAVYVGALQNICSKSCKYSFFDTTKEIAFLHLDKETRDKGKASVDMIGGRFGKSFGALIQFALLSIMVPANKFNEAQEYISGYIGFILLVIIVIWFFSVLLVGHELGKYSTLNSNKGEKK